MKKLTDYKGEEAFELWADLMQPLMTIFQDVGMKKFLDGKHSYLDMAAGILRDHKSEVAEIFTRIDPEPIDGSNLLGRLLVMLGDLAHDPVIGSFFGLAGPAKTPSGSSGSATESIKDAEK